MPKSGKVLGGNAPICTTTTESVSSVKLENLLNFCVGLANFLERRAVMLKAFSANNHDGLIRCQ